MENICDGIKKLQIRVLEPVISEIEAGLANGVDYCGAAITGWELISADIVRDGHVQNSRFFKVIILG